MGQMADIRLGDVTRTIGRYRPALAAVGIIAVVAVALPGGAGAGGGQADEPFDPGFASSDAQAAVPAPPAEAPVAPAPSGGLTAAAPVFEVGASTPPPRTPPPSAAFSPAAGPPPGGSAAGDDGFSFTPQAPVEAPAELRITDSLWATLGSGTPLGTAGVPEAGLPVGTRLGETDKASYVRLEGTDTTLSLVEAEEGQRQAAGAAVQACAITDPAWAPGEAASFDDAPPVDTEACAPGTRGDDGTWTFDLSALGDPAAPTGFALLPGPDAPVDFQVTFSAAG